MVNNNAADILEETYKVPTPRDGNENEKGVNEMYVNELHISDWSENQKQKDTGTGTGTGGWTGNITAGKGTWGLVIKEWEANGGPSGGGTETRGSSIFLIDFNNPYLLIGIGLFIGLIIGVVFGLVFERCFRKDGNAKKYSVGRIPQTDIETEC